MIFHIAGGGLCWRVRTGSMVSPGDPPRLKSEGEVMKKNNRQIRKKGIDPIDCRMIEFLQKDGRLSNLPFTSRLSQSRL